MHASSVPPGASQEHPTRTVQGGGRLVCASAVPGARFTFTFLLFPTRTGGTPVFTEEKAIALTSPALTHVLGIVNKSGLRTVDFSQQLPLQVARAGSDTPVVRREPLNTFLGAGTAHPFGSELNHATAIGTAAPKRQLEVAGGGVLRSTAGECIIPQSPGSTCVRITATDAGGTDAAAVAFP